MTEYLNTHPETYITGCVATFERPSYPPSKSGEVKVFPRGYFLIPITLIEAGGLPALQPTPAEVVFFLLIINRFNLNQSKEFFFPDYAAGRTLNICCKTIQRSRNKLKDAGWLKTVDGRLTPGESPNQSTRYLELNCPGLNNGKLTHPYIEHLEMKRSTFEFMLKALRDERIKHRHIVAYLAVCYYEWQQSQENYHDYVEDEDFSVPKDTLRGFFGMQDAPKLIQELSQVLLPDGEALYRCIDKHHSLTIGGLRNCPAETFEEQDGQKTVH
jgi:hypothetical protein